MKLQRRYEPHEIRDLSPADFEDLRESGLSRAEWDARTARRAYGHLAAAVVHIAEAHGLLARHPSPRVLDLKRLLDELGGLIPDYTELPQIVASDPLRPPRQQALSPHA